VREYKSFGGRGGVVGARSCFVFFDFRFLRKRLRVSKRLESRECRARAQVISEEDPIIIGSYY
jgi:hypothetical protein